MQVIGLWLGWFPECLMSKCLIPEMWLHLIEIVLSYVTFVTENIKCIRTSPKKYRNKRRKCYLIKKRWHAKKYANKVGMIAWKQRSIYWQSPIPKVFSHFLFRSYMWFKHNIDSGILQASAILQIKFLSSNNLTQIFGQCGKLLVQMLWNKHLNSLFTSSDCNLLISVSVIWSGEVTKLFVYPWAVAVDRKFSTYFIPLAKGSSRSHRR